LRGGSSRRGLGIKEGMGWGCLLAKVSKAFLEIP
jgi:hypothetical protein